jgi:hypothetical protein
MQRNLPNWLVGSKSEPKKRPLQYPGNTIEKWRFITGRYRLNTARSMPIVAITAMGDRGGELLHMAVA